MANTDHIQILSEGAFVWNAWRNKNPQIIPDFTDFNFTKHKTSKEIYPDISGGERWIEHHWDYHSINFINVNLSGARLSNCVLSRKHIVKSNFAGADFTGAQLTDVLLKHSCFNNAIFKNVNLKGATIVESDFKDAIISDSYIFGASSWGREVTLDGAIQSDLIITREEDDIITVDDIRDANLIYNLYNNWTSGGVIDGISNKLVFILGNFSQERKATLDALKKELRQSNYVPFIFDFNKPQNKKLKESVSLFANLSKFIIADLTDGRSVHRELEIIVPHLTSVVIQPIILHGEKLYGMLEDIFDFQQVLPLFEYDSNEHLLQSLQLSLLVAIERRIKELRVSKNNH